MSTLRSPVVAYEAQPHPNADRLELAVVDGWRVVCRIGDFAAGEPVAHIPEGSILPQDLIVEMGLDDPPRLAGSKHNRVKAIRLRGVLSQGLIYAGERIAHLDLGDDAAEALGLTKWIPPVPVHMSGTMVPGPKIGFDIEDIKAWPDRLRAGEAVVVTEKLHGTFCCIGLHREEQGVEPEAVVSSKGHLSNGLRFDLSTPDNDDNLYVKVWRRHAEGVRRSFDAWSGGDDPFEMYLFGEICGPKVQDLNYGLAEPTLHLFDVRLRHGYEDWEDVLAVADIAGIEPVPELWRGPWSPELLDAHTDGSSQLAGHHREGIVVRPAAGRYDTGLEHPSGRGPGRVIFKSVSARHLLRKGGTEYH